MDPKDNPIVQRWHYLEWLDNVMILTFIVVVVVLCLSSWFAYSYQYKKLSSVLHFLGELSGVLALLYIFWRVFFSWKGYYY